MSWDYIYSITTHLYRSVIRAVRRDILNWNEEDYERVKRTELESILRDATTNVYHYIVRPVGSYLLYRDEAEYERNKKIELESILREYPKKTETNDADNVTSSASMENCEIVHTDTNPSQTEHKLTTANFTENIPNIYHNSLKISPDDSIKDTPKLIDETPSCQMSGNPCLLNLNVNEECADKRNSGNNNDFCERNLNDEFKIIGKLVQDSYETTEKIYSIKIEREIVPVLLDKSVSFEKGLNSSNEKTKLSDMVLATTELTDFVSNTESKEDLEEDLVQRSLSEVQEENKVKEEGIINLTSEHCIENTPKLLNETLNCQVPRYPSFVNLHNNEECIHEVYSGINNDFGEANINEDCKIVDEILQKKYSTTDFDELNLNDECKLIGEIVQKNHGTTDIIDSIQMANENDPVLLYSSASIEKEQRISLNENSNLSDMVPATTELTDISDTESVCQEEDLGQGHLSEEEEENKVKEEGVVKSEVSNSTVQSCKCLATGLHSCLQVIESDDDKITDDFITDEQVRSVETASGSDHFENNTFRD